MPSDNSNALSTSPFEIHIGRKNSLGWVRGALTTPSSSVARDMPCSMVPSTMSAELDNAPAAAHRRLRIGCCTGGMVSDPARTVDTPPNTATRQ